MKQQSKIQKLILATLFVFAVQFVFASFTSTSTSSTNSNKKSATSKYTLKNLSKFSNKALTLTSLRINSRLNAAELSTNKSSIQLTNGNTTFIYPYKAKVKIPKFKTPSSNNL